VCESLIALCAPLPSSVEQIGDFRNPNPVQNFHSVIRSDPNPVDLSEYLIQSGLYPKNALIKHFTAVINAVWISISDPVESFSKSSPIWIRFRIAESGWIAIRKPDYVQHCCPEVKKLPPEGIFVCAQGVFVGISFGKLSAAHL